MYILVLIILVQCLLARDIHAPIASVTEMSRTNTASQCEQLAQHDDALTVNTKYYTHDDHNGGQGLV